MGRGGCRCFCFLILLSVFVIIFFSFYFSLSLTDGLISSRFGEKHIRIIDLSWFNPTTSRSTCRVYMQTRFQGRRIGEEPEVPYLLPEGYNDKRRSLLEWSVCVPCSFVLLLR